MHIFYLVRFTNMTVQQHCDILFSITVRNCFMYLRMLWIAVLRPLVDLTYLHEGVSGTAMLPAFVCRFFLRRKKTFFKKKWWPPHSMLSHSDMVAFWHQWLSKHVLCVYCLFWGHRAPFISRCRLFSCCLLCVCVCQLSSVSCDSSCTVTYLVAPSTVLLYNNMHSISFTVDVQ